MPSFWFLGRVAINFAAPQALDFYHATPAALILAHPLPLEVRE